MGTIGNAAHRGPWNKGKIVGQKAPFKLKAHLGAARPFPDGKPSARTRHFQLGHRQQASRCDLVVLKVRDVCHGNQVASRAIVMKHKTPRPVQFEITQVTRESLQTWL